MRSCIDLREIQKQDHEALEKIIAKTWMPDVICNKDVAVLAAKAYLSFCLSEQTFSRVALVDGNVVGVIMANNINQQHFSFKYYLRALLSEVKLLFTPEGRAIAKLLIKTENIDKQLRNNSPIKYQGELSFFVVDEAYRGFGLGKLLLDCLFEYMEQEKIHNFYLYTDSECNYGFYEKQGLQKRGEISHTFHFDEEPFHMSFYLYDNGKERIAINK